MSDRIGIPEKDASRIRFECYVEYGMTLAGLVVCFCSRFLKNWIRQKAMISMFWNIRKRLLEWITKPISNRTQN